MTALLFAFAICAVCAIVVATLLASRIGRAGFPLPQASSRLGTVDGLRGYLALCVMLHHFYIWIASTRLGATWSPPTISVLNQLGAGSVALFFMATGLVFYPRILAGLRGASWTTVYVTRVFRIMPLVTVSVAVVTLIIFLRTGAWPDLSYIGGAARWISTWAEVPLLGYPDSGRINAYVLWSLKYEWVFYLLLLPLCAAAMDVVRSAKGPSWLVPTGLLLASFAFRVTSRWTGFDIDFLKYLPIFAVGMLAFELQGQARVRRMLTTPWAAAAAIVAVVIGALTTPFPYGVSLPLFGFFFLCIACGNSLFGLFLSRGARVLGECSFSIYLLHGIVLDVLFVEGGVFTRLMPTYALPGLLMVVVIILVPLAAVSFLMIERPAMAAGKALARWITSRRVNLDKSQFDIAP